jgi:hypothetical protein
MSLKELYSPYHNQGHRDPFSGAGVHAGQRGTASLTVPELTVLSTAGYTQANKIKDIVEDKIPEKRDKRRNVADTLRGMGDHNNKYLKRHISKQGQHMNLDINHLNRK